MKKFKFGLLIPLLAILACSPIPNSSSTSSSSETSFSSCSTSKEENTSSSTSSSKESTSSSKSSSSSSSKTSSSISSSSSSGDAIPARGENLPIGNKSVSGPNNRTPEDISEYQDYEFNGVLPENWTFIQGNNKVKNGDFYADGSLKFSHLWYGIQTPLINSWKKIEIRFHISQVNNCKDDGVKDDEPIFHIYGYNKDGYHISTDYLEQGAITVQKEGTYVRMYVRNIDISYLEFRLNANPHKGSQHYNFGVSQITLKGWDYE